MRYPMIRLGQIHSGITWLALLTMVSSTHAVEVDLHPQLGSMIDQLVSEESLDRELLHGWLEEARIDENIVRIMQRPAEAWPWYRYRPRFLTRKSIRNGEKFFSRYSSSLLQAEREFGVPAEIVVAIIGIETRYGEVTGSYRVLDSLTTLSLKYPRRSQFFLAQLKEFMILSAHGALDPLEAKGSYAGAIGIPQFMPSSYRDYAIDFDSNGRIDLIDSPVDAIGSVAHYLSKHGWHTAEPIVERLSLSEGERVSDFVTRNLKADISLDKLAEHGVYLSSGQFTGNKVGVVDLEQDGYHEFRIAYPNFFVLTRYNRSSNYAMTVFELAEKIVSR